jgi:hypothetical protein
MGMIETPQTCVDCCTEWLGSVEGSACPHCASLLDFNTFFERITAYLLCQRLQIVFDLASDEIFASKVFGAYSATARLQRIVQVLALRVVEDRPKV